MQRILKKSLMVKGAQKNWTFIYIYTCVCMYVCTSVIHKYTLSFNFLYFPNFNDFIPFLFFTFFLPLSNFFSSAVLTKLSILAEEMVMESAYLSSFRFGWRKTCVLSEIYIHNSNRTVLASALLVIKIFLRFY